MYLLKKNIFKIGDIEGDDFFHSFSIGNEYIQTQCKTHYKNILKIGDIDRDGFLLYKFLFNNGDIDMDVFFSFLFFKLLVTYIFTMQ